MIVTVQYFCPSIRDPGALELCKRKMHESSRYFPSPYDSLRSSKKISTTAVLRFKALLHCSAPIYYLLGRLRCR